MAAKKLKKHKLDYASDKKLYIRLLRYVIPYKWQFGGGIAALVALALTEPLLAALMKPLLDGTFVDKDPDHILWMPILLVTLAATRGLFRFISGIAMVWVGGRVVLDLRAQMMDRLLQLPTDHYDHQSAGQIIARVVNHVNQVTTAATRVITVLVRDTVKVIGLFAYALYLNWQLTMLLFVIIPPIAVVVNYFSARSRRFASAAQEKIGDLTHVLEESVHGHKVVKVFGGQQYERRRLHDVANWYRRYQFKIESAAAANVPIVELIATVVLGMVIYLGTSQAGGEDISVGEFVSFFTALALIISPIKSLAGITQPLQRGLAAAESVFELIDEIPEQDAGKQSISEPRGHIRFENVRFRYANTQEDVLKGVSFELPAGHTLALVGPSGSGKTTVANLLPRFYNATQGRILIDGIDVADLSLEALRSQIALVNQDLVLFNDTVAANIAYGLTRKPGEQEMIDAARQAHALEFIERLPDGFNTLIGDNGVLLSGGQRQRLAIARALLKNSPILILDEATSALDTESERLIQDALEALQRDRTTLVIAHRLSTIEHANQILVMERGEVLEAGDHPGLLAQGGLYADLYNTQFKRRDRQ